MTDEVHEQVIEAPADDVWSFMVDPAALSVWFGADAWLDPVPGGAIVFRSLDGSVRRGVVEVVEPGVLLTWRWQEIHGVGFGRRIGEPSTVSIALEPQGAATRVRIVETPGTGDPRTRAEAAT
ncbi:MAG TPA: SRPBCC domain-containing protein [Actinomycetota bacterium]|nr:SRPBCC domain-containing protein [Actinomycetota bacterium]